MKNYNLIYSLNLKKFLKQQHVTQKELAEKANLSKTTLTLIINGKYNPSLEVMSQISEVLGIPLFMFFINSEEAMQQQELKNGKVIITAIVSKFRAFQISQWHQESIPKN